jgi:hypothetical protein
MAKEFNGNKIDGMSFPIFDPNDHDFFKTNGFPVWHNHSLNHSHSLCKLVGIREINTIFPDWGMEK